jgi:hypothetical protein
MNTPSRLQKVGNAYATRDLRFRVQVKSKYSGGYFLYDAETGERTNLPPAPRAYVLKMAEIFIDNALRREQEES